MHNRKIVEQGESEQSSAEKKEEEGEEEAEEERDGESNNSQFDKIEKNSWVVVEYQTKRIVRHYIGKVLSVNGEEINVLMLEIVLVWSSPSTKLSLKIDEFNFTSLQTVTSNLPDIFLQYTKKPLLSPEIKSEANILDLNDVDYADASDEDQDNDLQQEQSEADAMTPAEAENLLSSKQDLLSDEEAQEVTRLLHHDDTRHWQPDPTSSFMQDSTSIQDGSMGPPSLNDSMGPPSLQEDSITEPVVEYAVVNKAHKLDHTKNFISSSLMNESTSSIDVSTQDFDGMSASMSKMDSSMASDSGLIKKVKTNCENGSIISVNT
ncbi:hypothetical protein QE152_g24900 [Popillia japonica]|uniref:Uncharacterized protein n=1 Tax=Popillia japonica TaxID=7064 RepID=A0AAW1K3D2_POPJA